MGGCECIETGCLCAETFRTEGHRLKTAFQSQFHLCGREVSFRPDEDSDVLPFAQKLKYVLLGEFWSTVAKVFEGCVAGFYEFVESACLVYFGQTALQALIHGRKGYFHQSLMLHYFAFATLADDGHKTIYSDFDTFLKEPFDTIDIFSGCHRQCHPIVAAKGFVLSGDYLHCCVFGVCLHYDACVAMAFAVYYRYLVTFALAEHTATVTRLLSGE